MSAPERSEPDQSADRGVATSVAASSDEVLLEWSVHLFRHDPLRVWGVALAALIAAAAGILFFKSIIFAAGGIILIVSSSAEYLLPIRHRITESKAECRYGFTRFEMALKDVRRIIPTNEGIKVSPLMIPSRLDAFRGVLLRFAPDGQPGDKASVMSVIEDRVTLTSLEPAVTAKQVSSGA